MDRSSCVWRRCTFSLAIAVSTLSCSIDRGPVVAPDAGLTSRDAGPTLRDAGPTLRDAGPTLRDAGPTLRDAGPTLRDAGPTEWCGDGTCDPSENACVCLRDCSTGTCGRGYCPAMSSCGAGPQCTCALNYVDTGCVSGAPCTGARGCLAAWYCKLADECDPSLMAPGCEVDEGCYLLGFDGTAHCVMAGTTAAEASCTRPYECMSGYSCLGSTGAYTCRKLCDTSDMDPGCTDTEVCTALGIPAPLGNVGYCGPA